MLFVVVHNGATGELDIEEHEVQHIGSVMHRDMDLRALDDVGRAQVRVAIAGVMSHLTNAVHTRANIHHWTGSYHLISSRAHSTWLQPNVEHLEGNA